MASKFAEIALRAIASSDFNELDKALAGPTLTRSFGILSEGEVVKLVGTEIEGGSIDWVTRPLTWNTDQYGPKAVLKPAEKLLHLLWQDLHSKLIRKLEGVTRRTQLSPKGAILCFFGRADFGIVIEYRKSPRGAIELRPLVARD